MKVYIVEFFKGANEGGSETLKIEAEGISSADGGATLQFHSIGNRGLAAIIPSNRVRYVLEEGSKKA